MTPLQRDELSIVSPRSAHSLRVIISRKTAIAGWESSPRSPGNTEPWQSYVNRNLINRGIGHIMIKTLFGVSSSSSLLSASARDNQPPLVLLPGQVVRGAAHAVCSPSLSSHGLPANWRDKRCLFILGNSSLHFGFFRQLPSSSFMAYIKGPYIGLGHTASLRSLKAISPQDQCLYGAFCYCSQAACPFIVNPQKMNLRQLRCPF